MASFITLSSSLTPNLSATTTELLAKPTAAVMTMKELVAEKATEAGVNEELALKIAFCESTYRQFADDGTALRGVHNPDDVGLFQINEQYHAKKSADMGLDIHTTEGNIDYAMYLLKTQGPKPWSASKPCWGEIAAKIKASELATQNEQA